jgi:hypothetical protein
MVDRSILSQNVSSVITYTPSYYPSEVCCQGKWYHIGKDNFLLYVVTLQYQKVIHWYRFDRIQDNSCFTVFLYWTNRNEKKKYAKLSIYWSWCATTNHICTIKIRRAPPTRHDNIEDFRPIITRTSEILPLSVVVTADRGYDSVKTTTFW